MLDFNSALKDSLEIAAERFKKADADLREVVAAAGSALSLATAEALTMDLVRESRRSGMIYKVVVEHKAARDQYGLPTEFLNSTLDFRIPAKGYPIEHGTFDGDDGRFECENRFENKTALEAFVAGLLSNSESPFVLRAMLLLADPPEVEEPRGYVPLPERPAKKSDEDDDDPEIAIPF